MSMTMHAKDDPNDATEACMRCRKPEKMRIISTVGNDLRLYLCQPCHARFAELSKSWLLYAGEA